MTASVEQSTIAVADFYVALGQRIAEARTAAGMSQDELGAHNVVRYAAVLGVELLWLLTVDPTTTGPAQDRTEPLRADR